MGSGGPPRDASGEASDIERISTGVPGLDTVLHGGFLVGGTYVLSGPPGAGKTVLGNQFCFSAVRAGGRAVYVSLLAETHGRLVSHLRSLSFFDPNRVGDTLSYVSGYGALQDGGPSALLKLLVQTVREQRATVLVLDGIKAVGQSARSPLDYREFLHKLSVHAAVTGCTTLLLTSEQEKGAEPEFAMVDGVVALSAELLGLKAIRGLEIIKFRGSGSLSGKHTFTIGSDGMMVYPRTEALYAAMPEKVPDFSDRLETGIAGLDEMLDGGLVRRSSTLVFGSPGSGKTLLGLHFLARGAELGEPTLYFGFAESPNRLVAKAGLVGLDLSPHRKSGRLQMEARPPVETLPDELVAQLLKTVEEHGIRRLFVDGLEPFAKEAIDPERTTRFVTALINALQDRDVTSIFTQQTNMLFGPELFAPLHGVEALVDNIVFVRFVELESQLRRMLSILKMRESDCDMTLREFEISSDGLAIGGVFESAESLLTGLARPLSSSEARRVRRARKKRPNRLRRLIGKRRKR